MTKEQYVESVRLGFVIYCDEHGLLDDEARKLADELESQLDFALDDREDGRM